MNGNEGHNLKPTRVCEEQGNWRADGHAQGLKPGSGACWQFARRGLKPPTQARGTTQHARLLWQAQGRWPHKQWVTACSGHATLRKSLHGLVDLFGQLARGGLRMEHLFGTRGGEALNISNKASCWWDTLHSLWNQTGPWVRQRPGFHLGAAAKHSPGAC